MSVSSSSWGLGRAAVCDCGTPWTFLLPFFIVIGIITVFDELTIHPSTIESPEYRIDTPACVRLDYLGDVSKMILSAVYQDSSKYILLEDKDFVSSASWRSASVIFIFEPRHEEMGLQHICTLEGPSDYTENILSDPY